MASANTKRSVAKAGSDLYNTPEGALDALFTKVWLPTKRHLYFEPCNGLGKISDYLENKGMTVVRNELNDYGVETDFREDFLNPDKSVDRNLEI